MERAKIRVLLVDDEAQFRATTEKILRRRGFETLLADSGEEALALLEQRPDVVILDIKMAGMDGLETLGLIRNITADIPVIMLTGHSTEQRAKRALAAGAFDFLAKPCDIDLLVSKINEACRFGPTPKVAEEKTVREIMIPVADYTTIGPDQTVAEAITALRESFSCRAATDSIMETGHRSILVTDQAGGVLGVVAITDLLDAIMPRYLKAPKPSLADSIQYSPMFWHGMYSREVKEFRSIPARQLMSPPPPEIAADANLMEAAYLMVQQGARRLAVVDGDTVVGVVREQDLFFEMARIIAT